MEDLLSTCWSTEAFSSTMDSSYSPRSVASAGLSRRRTGSSGLSTSSRSLGGSPRHYNNSGKNDPNNIMAASSVGLTQFDFSAIEAMDPSVQHGWRCIFDREVPLELRYQESRDGPQDVGTLEAIKVKVLVLGSDAEPEALRIELSSETDLFFHYTHTVDESGFRMMQEQQKLMVEFEDYTKVLTRMLNSCIKEPNTHLAIFVLQEDGPSRLDFIKNMEYKFVELLTCDFARSSEDLVRQHIAYRYNAMKSRLALMQARLSDVNALVKLKNPSLLLQIRRPSGEIHSKSNSARK